jgi:hypothetical protein
MGQHQTPRRRWKDNRLAWAIAGIASISLLIITTLGYWQNWTWTELLWRWLELLIIPAALVFGAFLLNRQTREREEALASQERENDREIAKDRTREDTLQRYLDRISELVLDKNLHGSKRDDAVRATARARTLTVLKSLDGNRKGQVLRFLYEAGLITKIKWGESGGALVALVTEPIIGLKDADLSNLYLGANLWIGIGLSFADLSNANLRQSALADSTLRGANLSNANVGPNFHTDLSLAVLRGADLRGTSMIEANLEQADLSGADLRGAYMTDANLSRARNWTNEQLAKAESLVGATMPDGTVMLKKDGKSSRSSIGSE